jgi:hypothetical protein
MSSARTGVADSDAMAIATRLAVFNFAERVSITVLLL